MSEKLPVRFLMVLNDIDWFWSHRLPLAKAIQEQGWDLHLATHSASQNEQLRQMNVTGHELPKHESGLSFTKPLFLMRDIYKAIKTTRPQMIHAITLKYALFTGLVARLTGTSPVVFTVAGLGSLYTAPGIKMKVIRALVLPLIRFAFGGKNKFVIFQNPDDRAAMLKQNIIGEDKTTIIRGSGVDLNEFSYEPYDDERESEPIILFTSRLVREKGITDFVEAARILKSKNTKARFVVAGNVYPENARSLSREEMQDYHDEGTIEWLGHVEDMPDLLRRSMMVVLPSYYGEGVPKVLLETAAIGRPIVTCDAPGCREAVEHEVNGVLVLPQCPEEIADAIEDLINDPKKRHCYGAAGRRRMEEDFHVDSVVARTIAVYKHLLEE